MEYYNLIIRKSYNRIGLAKFFRKWKGSSLQEAFLLADNLPYKDTSDSGFSRQEASELDGIAEYAIIKIQDPFEHVVYNVKIQDPFEFPQAFPSPVVEDDEENVKAMLWYSSLSEEDQKHVNILVERKLI